MRQVPQYSLIGGGKVAHHTAHYLSQLSLPFWQWKDSRSLSSGFQNRLFETPTTHALLLIADSALVEKTAELRELQPDLQIIHFSGATFVEGAVSAHPLYTFGTELYDLETYRRIPFVIPQGRVFSELLPGLPNPSFGIDEKQRELYHALAVMAGNFPMAIWGKVFHLSEKELHLPREVFFPYLMKALENAFEDPQKNLTGPRKRGDLATIEKHLQALKKDPSALKLYQAGDDFLKEFI